MGYENCSLLFDKYLLEQLMKELWLIRELKVVQMFFICRNYSNKVTNREDLFEQVRTVISSDYWKFIYFLKNS